MAFQIGEEFTVQAPVARVWEYLIDPAKVSQCIPGAALLESPEDGTFIGTVKVKVGPITVSYKGTVKFTEVDEANHHVRLVGEGRETGGTGSAKVTMSSRVSPAEGGGALVNVSAQVDLVGKIVQFGRGMIEEVSRQLFRQFSACVKQHLEVANAPPPVAESTEASATEAASAGSKPSESAPAVEAQPVSAAPLVLRALWAVVARFFRRLFGRASV